MKLQRDHLFCVVAGHFLGTVLNRNGAVVRLVDVPELTDPTASGQRVELVAEIDGVSVALEHTRVESFPNQIQDGQRLENFSQQVKALLPKPLPPGHFRLSMATDALDGVIGRKQTDVADEIAQWVYEKTVEMASTADEPSAMRRIVDPLSVTLWYREGVESADLRFGRWVPDDLEALRETRLVAAFESKLPKLADVAARQGSSQNTCLVLEDQDFSLSNTGATFEAGVRALEKVGGPEPTWMVVAETLPRTTYWSLLYADGAWCDPKGWEDAEFQVPESGEMNIGDVVEMQRANHS